MGYGPHAALVVATEEHTSGRSDLDADRRLVRRAAQGDSQAQQEVLVRTLPYIRGVARAMIRASSDVEDAVQVAALKVLRGLASYRGDAPLTRWARTVTTRSCLDRMRQRGLQVVDIDSEPLIAPALDGARLAREALPRPIREYLDRLPLAQREALILRHVLDHSVAEAAEIAGVPVDTLKSRLLAARKALRKSIRRDLAVERGQPGSHPRSHPRSWRPS